MKNLYILLFISIFLTTSCEKGFEELNQNPFFPTQTDVGPLFNKVISTLTLNWDEQFYLHNDTYYEITQQAALSSKFSAINTNGTEGVWTNYYTALVHIREIEKRFAAYEGNPETLNNAKAMLKTLLAYYTFLKGDMRIWRKFANSLRLRHAMRMVEKDPAFAEPILKEMIENDLPIVDDGDLVAMHPMEQGWLKQSTHWSFREHKNLRMGSTIWSWLSEDDSVDGSGIFDPRAYIFFETNNDEEWRPYPQIPNADTPPIGGIPYQGHRDVNYFSKGSSNIYSPLNYYLIRDENDVPELILTPAEGHFIKAEAYLRGLGVGMDEGNASAEYTNGVVASISMWQDILANTTIWEHQSTVLSVPEIFAVVNHPNISIFSNDNKLELIYAQRWLDAFRQPWEAFSLGRRTAQTPREGAIPVYYRNTYPPSEAENNPDNWATEVAQMGGDVVDVKMWWMP